MSLRRKLAIVTWSPPREANIYGKITLDVTKVMAYLDEVSERTGEKPTITHFVGKVVARALAQVPTLNGRILLGRYIPHETADVAFLVSLDDGADLAKVKVCKADEKSVTDIGRELRERAVKLRKHEDKEFESNKVLLKILPSFILRWVVWFVGWLTGAVGLDARALGLERFPFGASIITNVGVFGLDEGFVPPTPFARVPLYVLLGAINERPTVVDGAVVVQPQITICATLDHRFIDGAQVGTLAKILRAAFEDPWAFDGEASASPSEPAKQVTA